MADGIKFLIELDSKTKGAADAIHGLGGVSNAAEKANEHIKGMGDSGKGLSRDVFSAELAVHALEHAWNGAKWAAEKVRDIVKETINTVADAERSKMALTNLMGSEGAASGEIKFLEKFAQLTEFSKKETEGFGISLLKAGYKGREFEDALAAIADVTAISTDKIGGAQDALSALTSIKLTGKLDARKLKNLGLDARDVAKDIGKALGMDPAVVKKQLTDGAIPAAAAYGAVLRAIERKTGKGLSEAGQEAGKGLSAKLTHLGDLPERLMARLEGSPEMERIKDKFDKMLGALDPDSPKGQKIIGGLERIMGAIADVDFAPLISVFTGLPQQLGTWVGPLSKIIALTEKLANIFLSIPQAIEDAGDALSDIAHGNKPGTTRDAKIRAKVDKDMGLPALRAEVERLQALNSTPFVRPEDQAALARFGGALDRPLTLSSMRGAAGQGLEPTGKGIGALVKTWDMTIPTGAAAPLPNMAGVAAAPTVVSPIVTVPITINGATNPEETGKIAAKHVGDVVQTVIEKRAIHSGGRSAKSRLGAPATGAPR